MRGTDIDKSITKGVKNDEGRQGVMRGEEEVKRPENGWEPTREQ